MVEISLALESKYSAETLIKASKSDSVEQDGSEKRTCIRKMKIVECNYMIILNDVVVALLNHLGRQPILAIMYVSTQSGVIMSKANCHTHLQNRVSYVQHTCYSFILFIRLTWLSWLVLAFDLGLVQLIRLEHRLVEKIVDKDQDLGAIES